MISDKMVFGLIYAIVIMAVVAFLLIKRKMGWKGAVLAAAATLLIGGFLLGGVPDPVGQFYQAVRGLSLGHVPVQPLIGLAVLTGLSLLVGRLFCGHACPVGAVQELMSRLTPRKLDISCIRPWTVRAVFTVAIAAMAVVTPLFLSMSPFKFFDLTFALGATAVFLILLIASVVVYRPWCRLFCPFGAISELAARKSAFRLRKNADCNNCGLCDRVCPTEQFAPGSNMSECYLCGRCLDICPKDSLVFIRENL